MIPGEGNRKTGGKKPTSKRPVEDLHSHTDRSKGPVNVEQSKGLAVQVAQEEMERRAHHARSRKKGRKNRWFFRGVWLCVIIMVAIGIAQFCVTCMHDMLGFGKPNEIVTIELKKDATTAEIAKVLKSNGVIQNPWAFQVYAGFTSSDEAFEYGTFQLSKNMDYQAIIDSLMQTDSRVSTVAVTFREGMQVTQFAKALEEAGVCTEDEFIAAVNNKTKFERFEFVSAIQSKEGREYFLEGYLFPDTYEFFKGEGATDALEKLLANTNNKLTASLYRKADEVGLTMDEVITLASMIQKEAADKQDMHIISSVFHNRMQQGYQYLNSDPTMWYPYLTQKDAPEGYDSAYNTYTHQGLPVGPISNPGMSAIMAALEPADTNYLYFCHDAEGTPYYAASEWEHEQNKIAAGLA